MKPSELKELTHEELMDRYRKFKEELFHVRFQLATGQLEKTHRLQALRRDLARVLTFLSQRQPPAPVKKAAPASKASKAEKHKVTQPAKAEKTATKAPPKAKKPGAAK